MNRLDLIIDALSFAQNSVWSKLNEQALAAARELQALAQPDQKPVDIHCPSCLHSFSIVPVAKREWVGLTDDDVAWADGHSHGNTTWTKQKAFSRAIEAKLKEKNGGSI